MATSKKRTRSDIDKHSNSSQSKRTRFAISSDEEQQQVINAEKGIIASHDQRSSGDLSREINDESTNDEHQLHIDDNNNDTVSRQLARNAPARTPMQLTRSVPSSSLSLAPPPSNLNKNAGSHSSQQLKVRKKINRSEVVRAHRSMNEQTK
jgi:hypothetical protein